MREPSADGGNRVQWRPELPREPGPRENELLRAEGVDPAALDFAVKTWSLTDVGQWTGKRRVWAACRDRELLLFAPGKAPYFERVPFPGLAGSLYNHVTAALLLAPASPRVGRLKVDPGSGYELLERIGAEAGRRELMAAMPERADGRRAAPRGTEATDNTEDRKHA